MWSLTSLSRRTRTVLLLTIIVSAGAALRLHDLGASVLWVDEAESAINALTIVADGLPGDRFLGQPIYENTLVRTWPDHPEYEFRDLSYSDRGLAVYHSWIPLYAIAAAFRLAGVTPEDARRGPPVRNASQAEVEHWTFVPRAPSVVFAVLLILAAYRLGRVTHSPAVGLSLALMTACSTFFVDAGRQARYYSAALAFTALAGAAVWVAWRRGRWIDHALAGLTIGLLFHVHSVSAVAMTGLYILSVPLGLNQPKLFARMVVAGTTAALLIVPWALWTGMFTQAELQPPARTLLDAQMVIQSLPRNPVLVAALVLGLCWFAAAVRPATRMSEKWRRPVLDAAPVVLFALAWLTASYLVYFLAMPAASFFQYRLRLTLAVPGALLLTVFVVEAARLVRPSGWAPLAAMALLLMLAQQFSVGLYRSTDPPFFDFIAEMRQWRLAPGSRIYASPNEHLVLTYYTGRLVQSIAPIRREWLNRFDGDLVIIEARTYLRPPLDRVLDVAMANGVRLTPEQGVARAREAVQLAKAQDLVAGGAHVESPATTSRDALDPPLVTLVRDWTAESVAGGVAGTPLASNPRLANWDEFRESFFYWFAGGGPRWGERLNYATCRATARVDVHPSGFAVLDCRHPDAPPLRPM